MKKILKMLLFIFPVLIFGKITPINIIKPDFKGESHLFSAIMVSRFDRIYTIDQINNEIYLLNQKGSILNSTGGFGWKPGLFDKPTGISTPDGLNIFIADYNNQRIAIYDRQLNFLNVFPENDNPDKQFYPIDIAVSQFGKFFILDDENIEILAYSKEEVLQNRIGGIDYGEYALSNPIEMIINQDDELFVLENNRIISYSIYGKPLKIFSLPDTLTAQSFCLNDKYASVVTTENKLYIYNMVIKSGFYVEPGKMKLVENMTSCFVKNEKLYLMNRAGQIYIFNITDLTNDKEVERFQK